MSDFKNLFDILRSAERVLPWVGKRLDEAEAIARWPEAVGPQIAKVSRVLGVFQGIMRVEVSHPTWRTELMARKPELLALLNRGGQVITELDFVDTVVEKRRAFWREQRAKEWAKEKSKKPLKKGK